MWPNFSVVAKLRLGIATWIVLLGALATLPLCVFLYASYRAEMGQLRQDARASEQREAAAAARALTWRLQAIASQLRFIDRLAEQNGGRIVVPESELLRGLVGITFQPSAAPGAQPAAEARGAEAGSGTQLVLSPFVREGSQDFAFLTVPGAGSAPGAHLSVTGKILLDQLLGSAEALPGGYLVDQKGRAVGVGSAARAAPKWLSAVRARTDGQGEFVDIARLRALPVAAEVQGGWTVAISAAAADFAAREEAVAQRFMVGGLLSLCVGLILLHFVAQRLRSQLDEVVTDFGDPDGQAPISVISEFAEIGGALASARAKAGRTELELERAKHDSLTGLPGRELFLQRAEAQVQAARAMDDHGVALLYIDLDGFKAVNDSLGHKAGDDILQQVGATLRQCVRSPDAVGRTGGDEFVVCFAAPRQHLNDLATRACERITDGVSRLGGGIGCSIGWATSSAECNLLELMDEADAAMYLAKSARKHHARMAAAGKA